MEEKNISINRPKNYDPQAIIQELKKLKPVEKEYAELFEKTEEIILSQYKTIQRLSDIVVKDEDKGIEDISKTISEAYEEFKQQLQIAQYVQKAIFPKKLPDNDSISMKVDLMPMEETSSDFYDIFEILPERVYGVVVVDVSGHGVSAALVTSMVKMLFSNAVSKYLSPKLVLSYVNKELAKTLKQSSYLSCFYCIIDLYDKDLVYVTAGHTSNNLYHTKTSEFVSLNTDGPMVGVDEKYEYEEKKVKIEYGDKLLIFTDGLAKLTGKENETYDNTRLTDIVKNNPNLKTEELLEKLSGDVKTFKGEEKQHDDITIMLIDTFEEAKNKIKKGAFRIEESQKLIDYYKKLLKLKEQDSDKRGIIEVLLNMSDIYTAIGKYDKSISYLNDALNLSYGINDKVVTVEIIDKLAELYIKIGNLKKGIQYVNKNLTHYKNTKDEKALIKAFTLRSQIHHMQRKPELAIKWELKSLQLANKQNDLLNMALSYNRIGVYYHSENELDKAMEYYKKGTEIINSLEEDTAKAKLLNNIGNIHRVFGNFDKALKNYEQSLKILQEWEDNMSYMVLLHNLGELYMKQENYDKALEYLNKAMKSSTENKVPSVESVTMIIRAELYLKLNNLEECLWDATRALKIIEDTKVDFYRGKIFTIIGRCFSELMKEENKSIKENNINKINEILDLCKLGFSPEKYYKRAITRSKNPVYSETYIPALYEYALYLDKQGEKDKAPDYFKEAYQLANKYNMNKEKENIEKLTKELGYKL